MKPAVRAGKPRNGEDYIKEEAGGFEFYISKELQDRAITIDRAGWWIFGGLQAAVS